MMFGAISLQGRRIEGVRGGTGKSREGGKEGGWNHGRKKGGRKARTEEINGVVHHA